MEKGYVSSLEGYFFSNKWKWKTIPLMKGNKDWRDLWEGRVLLLILMSRKPGEVWVDGKREAFELRPEYPSMILKENTPMV